MDPHSRFSQFNTRQPKAGPDQRRIETPMKTLEALDNFRKKAGGATFSKSASSPAALGSRPIVTNSRVKQGALVCLSVLSYPYSLCITDEQFRKDMHLAFVTNALQQKSKVCKCA